jgi:hypothetical protein
VAGTGVDHTIFRSQPQPGRAVLDFRASCRVVDPDRAQSTSRQKEMPMRTNKASWVVQSLLFLLFAFAGGVKLVLPPEAMQGPVYLPILFVRFIGVAEVLGAIGLILPGLFRLRRELTPLGGGGPRHHHGWRDSDHPDGGRCRAGTLRRGCRGGRCLGCLRTANVAERQRGACSTRHLQTNG